MPSSSSNQNSAAEQPAIKAGPQGPKLTQPLLAKPSQSPTTAAETGSRQQAAPPATRPGAPEAPLVAAAERPPAAASRPAQAQNAQAQGQRRELDPLAVASETLKALRAITTRLSVVEASMAAQSTAAGAAVNAAATVTGEVPQQAKEGGYAVADPMPNHVAHSYL